MTEQQLFTETLGSLDLHTSGVYNEVPELGERGKVIAMAPSLGEPKKLLSSPEEFLLLEIPATLKSVCGLQGGVVTAITSYHSSTGGL